MTESSEVPFAGLRQNARALGVGIAILLGVFLLVPDIAPRPSDLPPIVLVHGRIVEIVAAVPITTAIAVGLIGRRLPFVGEGTGTPHAPGWD